NANANANALQAKHEQIVDPQLLRNILMQIHRYVDELNKQKEQHLRELETARKKFKKSMHQISLIGIDTDDAKEIKEITALREEVERARQDKIALLRSTQSEIDRMRSEMRQIGKMQREKQQTPVSSTTTSSQSHFGWPFIQIWSR
ncbi:hypothetical protein RFI_14195, partial [Reticulomyxa filosa]